MITYRAFPYDPRAPADAPGGPLWYPREWQRAGRHDNPERYGCLYVSEAAVSPIAEALAVFRGSANLLAEFLIRGGLPLALATLELPDGHEIVDLDDPRVLLRNGLRPSRIATGARERTQADALSLFERHPASLGLRWWSTLEASWLNITLFDRAASALKVEDLRTLTLEDPAVTAAAEAVGLPLA